MMAALLQDLRYGLRQLARNPGFTLAAVLTLALGIGVNTIIFGLVNGLLVRPLPVEHADRLVALFATDRRSGNAHTLSYQEYLDYRDRSGVFAGLAAQQGAPLSLGGSGQAEVVWSEIVTENYFDVLGLRPEIGRGFTARDASGPGSDPLAVLSHRLWQRRFGGTRDVIGKTINLNGHQFTVVGVAPKGFTGTRKFGFWPDVWVPLQMYAQVMPGSGSDMLDERGSSWLQVFGRLAPGLDRAGADAAVTAFAARLEQQFPDFNRDEGARLISAGTGFDDPDAAPPQVIFLSAALAMAAVGLVLLLACANVANLLMARASTRGREIAVRRALGASRPRLIRQFLTESLLLALAGGAGGIALAAWSSRLEGYLIPRLQFSVGFDTSIDYRVLAFALAASVLAALLFGLAPGIHASRFDLVAGFKGEGSRIRLGKRSVEVRSLLVAGQVAFSLILLVGSGLFLKSLLRAQSIDPGLARSDRVLLSLNPGLQGYDETRSRQLYHRILDQVRTLPGVASATLTFPLPLDTYGRSRTVFPAERAAEGTDVGLSAIGTDYFATVGGALVGGREFEVGDTAGSRLVAIVNETMARRFWNVSDVVGRTFRLGEADGPLVEVVGVARDGKYGTIGEQQRPYMYLPVEQDNRFSRLKPGVTLVVHGTGEPRAMISAVREVIGRLDPDLGTFGAMTMAEHVENALNLARTSATLASAFGLSALLLAVIGIYGVVSYAVARRTREVGIRVALGAGPGDVVRLVFREGIGPSMVGMAAGLATALAVTGLVRGMLYDVSPRDASVFLSIPLVLGAAAALATYLPARRALRVDPITALRSE